MAIPPAKERWAAEFSDGWARTEEGKIHIVFWIEDYHVYGEAYFTRDDYCAQIVKGQFKHPSSGLEYQLFVHLLSEPVAILEVWRPINIGHVTPKRCE